MLRLLKTRSKSTGLPPGTLVVPAEKKVDEVKIRVVNFTEDSLEEKYVETIEECIDDASSKEMVTWINIKGLTDKSIIQSIGKTFGIHTLWLEDVLNTDHRPKLEELDDLIFCIIKAVSYGVEKKGQVSFEQLSLFLSDGFVISFQEFPEDVFEMVGTRLRKKKGRIRESKADYLFYALIDCVVDDYFSVLEKLGREIEELDNQIFKEYDQSLYQDISRLKNELVFLRKSAVPIKDVLHQCVETEKNEIQSKTKKYFKDAYDHIVQVSDIIDSYFSMLDSSRDSFHSIQANKMNEVMKVLTIFSALFIPLTFIAGVYGMNFKNIPELNWDHGYAYAWGLMIAVGIGLVYYFRSKKWF